MGLKKFAKKIKKGVKKVLKSPVGKIAATAGAAYFGGPALTAALGGGAAGATGAGALLGAGTQALTGGDWKTGALLGGAGGFAANQYGLLGNAPTQGVSGVSGSPQEIFRAGEIASQNAPSWSGALSNVGTAAGKFLTSGPGMSAIAGGLLGGAPMTTEDSQQDYGPAVNYGMFNAPQPQYGATPQNQQVNPYMPPLARRGNENSGAWRFAQGVPYGAA